MKTKTKKITKKIAVDKVKKVSAKKVTQNKSVSIPVKRVVKTKVSSKKSAPVKKVEKRELVVASNYNSFWMNNGQILNTLTALEGALKNMDNAVYKYHTANGRHDFANWVEDVLHDLECANALRKAKTAKSAYTVVVKYTALYK